MGHTYKDNAEHELDILFPTEILRGINIEFMDIPRSNYWDLGYLLREDGMIILDIKNSPREKLKSALYGAILLSPENYDYVFGYSSVIDRKKESEIEDLVEKIISEPSSLIADEMGYMIKKAEIEYIKRSGGNFEYH